MVIDRRLGMKFSCCIPTYQPTRTEEAAQRFWAALRSAEPFDEIVVALEARDFIDFSITCDLIKEVCPKAKVIEVNPDPTPIEKRLSGGEYFNVAVEASTGDWISLLCDDDEYNKHNVKILIQQGDRLKDEAIVYTPYYCLDKEGKLGVFGPPTQPQQVDMDSLLKVNYLSNSSFVSRRAWEELGGRRKNTCCDWDMWVRAMKRGIKFNYFPYPIYMQRFYDGSLFMRQREVWKQKEIYRQLYLEAGREYKG